MACTGTEPEPERLEETACVLLVPLEETTCVLVVPLEETTCVLLVPLEGAGDDCRGVEVAGVTGVAGCEVVVWTARWAACGTGSGGGVLGATAGAGCGDGSDADPRPDALAAVGMR